MSARTSVVFVCLGNICRSPVAESTFRHLVRERGVEDLFEIDSAGTADYHVGDSPDPRSVRAARARGVEVAGRGRQLRDRDLLHYDYIVVMDGSNLRDVEELQARSGGTARIHLLREWDPEAPGADVPDPYYGGPRGFEDVHEIIVRSCENLLDALLAEATSG